MENQRRNNAYYTTRVKGNTVRKLAPAPRPITAVPERKLNYRQRKNLDKARNMDLKYVLFLVCALLVTALTLTVYLGLQSDITNSIKQIARLERELNNLRLTNDENYSRITNNVDLDKIRRIAIKELGMVYATEGQVVDFSGNKGDYVRQINPLPQE